MTKEDWYKSNNCEHAHCPYECEHPQPMMDGHNLICGKCLNDSQILTKMIPCNPETCND